ncbi:MAG: purine-binding chemotaxis protein CheW [Deltaproteobacteria bacterium]|nr:purine-binding chemotaxis protein CheW [Deltaproteobacteria bacterium]
MDIAEIRKKAKALAQSQDQAQAQAQAQAKTGAESLSNESAEQSDYSAQGSEPLEAQGEIADIVVEQESAVSFAEDMLVSPETTDGLDRLFAVTDEFVLASDESYADIIEHQDDDQSQLTRQYLAFHLSDEEYALDIRQINEIIKVREFTDIPRAPEFVLGIISLRGVIVPVFDLRQRLNLGSSELMSTSRIVVCLLDEVTVGLMVDSINQVVDLSDEDVEPPPGVLSGLDREMVAGIGRYQGRMIILLNLPRVLDIEACQT